MRVGRSLEYLRKDPNRGCDFDEKQTESYWRAPAKPAAPGAPVPLRSLVPVDLLFF